MMILILTMIIMTPIMMYMEGKNKQVRVKRIPARYRRGASRTEEYRKSA